MANKMLIDASHPEETRVVVLRGNRVEEFDFESASKRQLRGNIYLAKVTRVEPSLQAAFVDYGGNRHGFLAFSEIHPDYYQIPVADRQALIEEDARAHRDEDDEERGAVRRNRRRRRDQPARAERRTRPADETVSELAPADAEPVAVPIAENDAEPQADATAAASDDTAEATPLESFNPETGTVESAATDSAIHPHYETVLVDPQGYAVVEEEERNEEEKKSEKSAASAAIEPAPVTEPVFTPPAAESSDQQAGENDASGAETPATELLTAPKTDEDADAPDDEQDLNGSQTEEPADEEDDDDEEEDEEEEQVEQLGGDAMEEVPNRVHRLRRQYKIQEVIKRRQVLLVQVVKEERGNKGAALTTYLSLAGRYSVLMPNTARGGGISRKITDSADRSRLKAIAQELDVPEGMGVILRTAGASRTKAEVKRDFEYLLRMWESVRELTLSSTAPTLVYEEGSLIKRSIRDLYNKDIDEVTVAGDEGYKEAKDFMRMLMPSHAKNVKPYRDVQPIFAKAGADAQLDALFSNQVTLRSGGYLVINQTEALVAIDVNSGRSTREHNIEDTALRTNLEAADELARQLRLRDLAGLIVVDFIDMEENRNNRAVERRLKEALRNDRARIQVGRISHFGLLEMSRQRIRTGVLEGSTVICPHCAGAGMVRSTASIALHVLRVLEEALIKSSAHNLIVRTRIEVALYILNQKRSHLRELEKRFGVQITVGADDTLQGTVYHALERGEPAVPPPDFVAKPLVRVDSIPPEEVESEPEETAESAPVADAEPTRSEHQESETETEADAARRRRRRRRRRGRGADREGGPFIEPDGPQPSDAGLAVVAVIGGDIPAGEIAMEPIFSDGETDEIEAEGFEMPEEARTRKEPEEAGEPRHRRRSRRGGRGRHSEERVEAAPSSQAEASSTWVETVPTAERETEAAAEPNEPATPADEVSPVSAGESPSATPVAVAASAETPPAEPRVEEPPAEATSAPETEQQTSSEPTIPEAPPGPKRTGWWQRAKASFGGG